MSSSTVPLPENYFNSLCFLDDDSVETHGTLNSFTTKDFHEMSGAMTYDVNLMCQNGPCYYGTEKFNERHGIVECNKMKELKEALANSLPPGKKQPRGKFYLRSPGHAAGAILQKDAGMNQWQLNVMDSNHFKDYDRSLNRRWFDKLEHNKEVGEVPVKNTKGKTIMKPCVTRIVCRNHVMPINNLSISVPRSQRDPNTRGFQYKTMPDGQRVGGMCAALSRSYLMNPDHPEWYKPGNSEGTIELTNPHRILKDAMKMERNGKKRVIFGNNLSVLQFRRDLHNHVLQPLRSNKRPRTS